MQELGGGWGCGPGAQHLFLECERGSFSIQASGGAWECGRVEGGGLGSGVI